MEDLEQKSDAVKEILSMPPPWLVRWGSTVSFLSICAMLALGWFVTFPDEIEARINIKSTNPPREVTPRSSGQLARLYVREGEYVKTGQLLAVIESDANYNDVFWLDSLLSTANEDQLSSLSRWRLPSPLALGEIEGAYVALRQTLSEVGGASNENYTVSSLSSIDEQIENIKLMQISANREQSKINQQLKQLKAEFLEHKNKDTEAKILELQRQLDGIGRGVQEYDNKIDQLRQEKSDRVLGSKRATGERFSTIREQLRQLKERTDRWKYKCLLVSPVAGEVVFLEVWDERQFVQAGEVAFAIKPASGKMYATGKLPSRGAGKVRPGQKVSIKLESYPHQEFGSVLGVVEKTFVIPSTKQNIVEISLPSGLMTTQKKELAFRDKMEGRADIYTENRRILQWIFEKMMYQK